MSWIQYRYNLSRVYPGRYTTLSVTIFFVFLSVILALVNIPLSAYSIQQDFLSNPNDTHSGPSSKILPALLRRDPGNFIPHTFVIGDTFQTNFSLLGPYMIQSIYFRQDTNGSPVPRALNGINSFVHRNYDLTTCDVLSMSLDLDFSPSSGQPLVAAGALISCWFPVFYSFDVKFLGFSSYYYYDSKTNLNDALLIMTTLGDVIDDLAANIVGTANVTLPDPLREGATIPWNGPLHITSEQCCTTCNDPDFGPTFITTPNKLEKYQTTPLNNATTFYDHPSCDDSEVKFKSFIHTNHTGFVHLPSIDSLSSSSALPLAINNTLRAVYHAIRLDLGVIRPNQIYNSPTRFNASIADISPSIHDDRVARDTIGSLDFSNATYSVHVPDLLYLTPLFKLKQPAQAITAVFVSTFTMLSAIWAIFNTVATSVIVRRSEHATYCPCPVCVSGSKTGGYASIPIQEKSESLV